MVYKIKYTHQTISKVSINRHTHTHTKDELNDVFLFNFRLLKKKFKSLKLFELQTKITIDHFWLKYSQQTVENSQGTQVNRKKLTCSLKKSQF